MVTPLLIQAILFRQPSSTAAKLGSYLAQFILVLANAALTKPAYILIDEPELNLHPSLQIDFLTTLAAYARVGVIFSTHSYGLARATAERIYSLRRGANGISELSDLDSTPRLSELLGELSYSGYRELGFGKVLLVEGGTDVKTMQQFLRKLGSDHQIVILPLGGSQFIKEDSETELQEILRICPSVFAVIDSERLNEGDPLDSVREKFAALCQRIGIRCHVLERKATENYLTDDAVKLIKGPKCAELGPYQDLTKSSMPWGKLENWRIAREMSKDNLMATDLGRFLASL